MHISIKRVPASNVDFRELVAALDEELKKRDGSENAFYAQYNGLEDIKHAIVAYIADSPVGCGAIKLYSQNRMEVKRMYVLVDHRRKGIAQLVLQSLEAWAAELGNSHCILETGKRQPEAIALYESAGYAVIENYGQYKGVLNSVCFEKRLLK